MRVKFASGLEEYACSSGCTCFLKRCGQALNLGRINTILLSRALIDVCQAKLIIWVIIIYKDLFSRLK